VFAHVSRTAQWQLVSHIGSGMITCTLIVDILLDSYQGILAARAVITPINIRLTPPEVEYILEHSGASIVLVDHAYMHLVSSSFPTDRVIVSHDTGRLGCPYEAFLEDGRAFSKERGWAGLPAETDEDAACSLCYT
jgi:long-subunit acyl-CoA synthetase (AMP-forming)